MTERIKALRERSISARPSVSAERALIVTDTYRRHEGTVPVPVLRALAFKELCEKKTIYIGRDELVVAERGPFPKATPTYPELNCHSVEDLEILRSRPMTRYDVDDDAIQSYRDLIIPFWRGRSLRDRAFSDLPPEWLALYDAGVFTEFMEQRAPGHTALDGLLYRKGLVALKEEALASMRKFEALLDGTMPGGGGGKDEITADDPSARLDELKAMAIACDAAITFAVRHAELAERLAASEQDGAWKNELLVIAETCRRVPAYEPRTLREAIQAYWFIHLGTITELNGWDAMSPGHFDQHLEPFYRRDLAEGRLTRERAKELLSSFWIKVNNTPAPPQVGVQTPGATEGSKKSMS